METHTKHNHIKTIGFIVNPIAGMGGAVGLKGTDGIAVLKRAVMLGAKPIAPEKAKTFLSELEPWKEMINLIVGAGEMGENEALSCGFTCKVVGERKEVTTARDTIKIAKRIKEAGVNLLVFCGGDGTARDILNAVDTKLPVLGVPTGVKMHSAVFAVEPKAAARIAMAFLFGQLSLKEAEVMDVDEEAFRRGRVSAELYGYMLVPYEPHLIQGMKMASTATEDEMRNQAAIAIYVIENMGSNVVYIVGPGTTTRTILDLLDLKKTLLGVDLICNKKLIAKDANEKQIIEKISDKEARIIVTPIGGQGFIFGRGNQQISPTVIKRVGLDNIIVIATEGKLRNLKSLRVDTGDPSLDDAFRSRPFKVITNYKVECIVQVG
ncbi:MAG: ATP-NAD kinase family protein [Candidatus Bathyarchaeia archaeon]